MVEIFFCRCGAWFQSRVVSSRTTLIVFFFVSRQVRAVKLTTLRSALYVIACHLRHRAPAEPAAARSRLNVASTHRAMQAPPEPTHHHESQRPSSLFAPLAPLIKVVTPSPFPSTPDEFRPRTGSHPLSPDPHPLATLAIHCRPDTARPPRAVSPDSPRSCCDHSLPKTGNSDLPSRLPHPPSRQTTTRAPPIVHSARHSPQPAEPPHPTPNASHSIRLAPSRSYRRSRPPDRTPRTLLGRVRQGDPGVRACGRKGCGGSGAECGARRFGRAEGGAREGRAGGRLPLREEGGPGVTRAAPPGARGGGLAMEGSR